MVTIAEAKIHTTSHTSQPAPEQIQGAVLGPAQTVCSILLTLSSTSISQVQFTVS